jgi:hypothetical protein
MATRGGGRSGWVYVLSNASLPGMVKVGRTCKAVPDERCASISRFRNPTQDGTPFVVEFAERFNDCFDGERGVHYRLDAYRVFDIGFELFAVSVEQAREAVLEIKALGSAWKPADGVLVQARRSDAKRIGSRSKRYRNPFLYAWLLANHDRLKSEIGSCTDGDADVFLKLRWEWLSSLPESYTGKGCSPVGLMLEWRRVAREVALREGYGERTVRWEVRSPRGFSDAGN